MGKRHQSPLTRAGVKYLAGTEINLPPVDGFGDINPIFGDQRRLGLGAAFASPRFAWRLARSGGINWAELGESLPCRCHRPNPAVGASPSSRHSTRDRTELRPRFSTGLLNTFLFLLKFFFAREK